MPFGIRSIRPDDAEECGAVAFEAHRAVAAAHNFPPEHPSAEFSTGLIKTKVADPNAVGMVAEDSGRIIGSGFLNTFPGTPVAAVGPLTVHPSAEGGAGRRLLEALLDEARSRRFDRVRLVQSPSHLRSLALYAKAGFTVREPLVLVQAPSSPGRGSQGTRVRPAVRGDLAACHELCTHVHGFARDFELSLAFGQETALACEDAGRITGYATGLGLRGHAVARTTRDLCDLIAAAPRLPAPGFFVPARNGELLRWLLDAGFRLVWPAHLMTVGDYAEPRGAFLPSIAF
ncbi:MAG TPA: GNAT family N-acetyltransferase [bacterium]|nr:GNAT family N-acetyltransferase [bacterium]